MFLSSIMGWFSIECKRLLLGLCSELLVVSRNMLSIVCQWLAVGDSGVLVGSNGVLVGGCR